MNHLKRHIITTVPTAQSAEICRDVLTRIYNEIKKFASIQYVYILDNTRLIGVVSLKELISANPQALINNIAQHNLVVAHTTTATERVGLLALHHVIKAIPIIDHDHNFVGVVPPDEIMKILHFKGVDNLLKMSGVFKRNHHIIEDIRTSSISTLMRHRFPWLLIGLIGGIISAYIIRSYEATLNTNILFASFIPLVVYMASAVSSQIQAFIIRDLALLQNTFRFGIYVAKQFSLTVAIAACLSAITSLFTFIVFLQPNISLIFGVSLFITILSSLLTGLFIPYFFYKKGFDPADASGPVATIIQDVLSVIIYLTIASALI